MRKLNFQINVSLDGVADHTVGIADNELHDFFTNQMNNFDLELFGRVTYQLMESYWPSAPKDPEATKSMIDFANRMNAMPKVVFSRTLHKVEWNNTTLVKDNMIDEVIKLKNQPGKDISVGGISIIQELMRHGLFDECWILVHPVLAGTGRRLFTGFENKIRLKLLDTSTFQSGVVVLHYSFIQ
jgi:dihydrofolate reductase